MNENVELANYNFLFWMQASTANLNRLESALASIKHTVSSNELNFSEKLYHHNH